MASDYVDLYRDLIKVMPTSAAAMETYDLPPAPAAVRINA
jgi:hypothetical protein